MTWERLGNGLDKEFWVKTDGNGGYGAICCSDEVAARETKAYIDLKTVGLGSMLPTIIPWTDRASIPNSSKPTQYQIKRIMLERTFKPVMCAFGVPVPVRKELKFGNRTKLMEGFEKVQARLDVICRTVGELTLAVDGVDGGLFILDLAPGSDQSTAYCQINEIKTGLENLKRTLASL